MIFKQLRKGRKEYFPLKRRKNIDFECREICKQIENEGKRVLNCIKGEEENLIIYRTVCTDNELEDTTVYLRMIVIRKKGILATRLRLDAVYNKIKSSIYIGDIKIFEDNINKGYGTLMLKELFKIASNQKVETITGEIHNVDWDHIDRLVHFYNKNGFEVTLIQEKREGKIVWLNKALVKT